VSLRLLIAALLALQGISSLTVATAASARCASYDTSCRTHPRSSSATRGDFSGVSRERLRQRNQAWYDRQQGTLSGNRLPSSRDLRPCQTRPVVSGKRTRVVPTC
jgi:hypothetical protein